MSNLKEFLTISKRYGDNKKAQELLDKFTGKGDFLKNGRERVDYWKTNREIL
ncbi:polymorphic toxin type 50 domain-containing protein [Bacillus stercoris]|nr:polymorphic toxin type 50 domain-containing protein [Bacillus stercoris]